MNTTEQRFSEKRGSFENLVRGKLASESSSVASQTCCYECVLNRIELPTGHVHIKLNSKWLPSLRLWVCTIGSCRSDARQKLKYRGPVWSGFMCKR